MHKGYASTQLGQIHYRRTGSGEPVVLLPQSGRSSHMHLGLMQVLAERYDVIAPDFPGSGESSPLNPETSFEDIAKAMLECVQSLVKSAFDLYGIHTGNKIGAAMAVAAPQCVKHFVFAGQSHSIIPNQQARNEVIRRGVSGVVNQMKNESEKSLFDWTTKLAEVNANGLSKSTLMKVMQDGEYSEPLARIVDELQAMASRPALYAANFAYDLERDLRRLTTPTLVLEVVTPEEDRSVGRQGASLLTLLQKGSLIELPAPNFHGITLEDRSEEVARILSQFFVHP